MSKTHEIKVTKRELQRKGASRRLRHAGAIPAIVYGGNAEPVAELSSIHPPCVRRRVA